MRAGDSVRGRETEAPGVDDRFREAYRGLLPIVFGFARARLSEQDAEDVTAEVFATMLQHMRQHPDVAVTESWAIVVTRNRIVDRWRRDGRWAKRVALLGRDLERRHEVVEQDDRVLDALDQLSTEHRAVIVLRYLDGATAAEVAEMLGRSSRAIDSLTARARRAFAAALGEES